MVLKVTDAEEIAPEVSCEIVIQKRLKVFGLSFRRKDRVPAVGQLEEP